MRGSAPNVHRWSPALRRIVELLLSHAEIEREELAWMAAPAVPPEKAARYYERRKFNRSMSLEETIRRGQRAFVRDRILCNTTDGRIATLVLVERDGLTYVRLKEEFIPAIRRELAL